MSWRIWTWMLSALQSSPMKHGYTCHRRPKAAATPPSPPCSGAGRFWTLLNQKWRLPGGLCPSDWNKSPGGVVHCPAPPHLLPLLL
ncbi:hypothetical protein LDENG_00078470 [Lucifuga dentata]|nr:hypothetical protein LDENG_00078470 [Lucifuga dentata]